MEKKRKRFLRDVIKTKKEYDLDDQVMDQWLAPEMTQREKSYKRRLISYVGKPLYKEASKWWVSLSPKEQKQTGAETEVEILQTYANRHGRGLKGQDVQKLINLDKRVRDDRFEPIGPPQYDESSGEVRPGPIVKVKKEPPKQPTPEQMKRMSVKEIASLIEQTRDALWPSGNSGDALIDNFGIKDK